MDKFELQKLRDLPIEEVAERLGMRVVRPTCLCPFHDDHHASLSFKVSKNTFRCFVCGASGGTIDLVMKYLNKDFKEACRWLGAPSNLPPLGEAVDSVHSRGGSAVYRVLPPSRGDERGAPSHLQASRKSLRSTFSTRPIVSPLSPQLQHFHLFFLNDIEA